MTQGSFSAKISSWVKETRERRDAVYRGSAQELLRRAQYGGNLPIKTGFLRASLVVSPGSDVPPMTYKPDGVERFTYDETAINLTISEVEIQQPITAAWTANYARHVEYGARGRAGTRFVGLAVQQWPQIVEQECAKAQARAGG